MSVFETRIEDSKINNHFEILFAKLADAKELEDLSSHEQDTIYRVEEVCGILKNRFFSVDPYMLPNKVIESIANHTNVIHTNLHAFIQNHISSVNNNSNLKVQSINKINESLDSVLISVTQIFYPVDTSDIEALKESIVSTRISLSQHNRYIKEEYEEFNDEKLELEQEIESLANQLTSIEEKMDNIVENAHTQLNEFERMFSEKQQERTKDYSELQHELREDYSEFRTELEATYSSSLDAMHGAYKGKVSELEKEFKKAKQQLDSRMDKYKNELIIATEELYSLIEASGSNAMSDGYAKYANKAGKRRFWWQVISVISLIALVLCTFFIIGPSFHSDDFSFYELVSRALITISLGALSGYTIRQSQLAYQEEQRNREMQLKLGSIEPYLKNFEQDKRNQIKEQLVTDYFSRQSSRLAENQQPTNPTGDLQTQEEQPTA